LKSAISEKLGNSTNTRFLDVLRMKMYIANVCDINEKNDKKIVFFI